MSQPNTQSFVPIKEIRDGIVILNDDSLRAVLMCSAINFTLRSADEQRAIIGQYQSVLNSLDFSAQIVVQSRKLDIRPYIMTLENRVDQIKEPLLKFQTIEYIKFIKELTESANIMSKHFYVIVPYGGSGITQGGFFDKVFGGVGRKKLQSEDDSSWEQKRNQLEQRLNVITQGLGRTGVRCQALDSAGLIELFYKTFNPGESAQRVPQAE